MAQRIVKDHTRTMRKNRLRAPVWALETDVILTPPVSNLPRFVPGFLAAEIPANTPVSNLPRFVPGFLAAEIPANTPPPA